MRNDRFENFNRQRDIPNGVEIGIATNSFRNIRGRSVLLATFDEVALWRDENSATPDVETYRAVLPSLRTFPDAMLVMISTPYRRGGLLFDKHREFYGKDSDHCLVIQASSMQLYPGQDMGLIEAERAADPIAAVSDIDGRFREDFSNFIDLALIEAAVDEDVVVRPPRPGVVYLCFIDSATGVGEDSFAAAIVHREGELIIVDNVYEKRPPFSADAAWAEVAGLCKAYGVERVVGDKFGAGLTIEGAARYGLTYEYSEFDKSQLYLRSLPLFSSGRVRLVDLKRMVVQFASLERRTSAIGRDTVTHPNNRHDDAANACAGAICLAALAEEDPVRESVKAWGNEEMVRRYDEAEAARRAA